VLFKEVIDAMGMVRRPWGSCCRWLLFHVLMLMWVLIVVMLMMFMGHHRVVGTAAGRVIGTVIMRLTVYHDHWWCSRGCRHRKRRCCEPHLTSYAFRNLEGQAASLGWASGGILLNRGRLVQNLGWWSWWSQGWRWKLGKPGRRWFWGRDGPGVGGNGAVRRSSVRGRG
jgi:hypothetical protein